jgi:hypothetical protein
MVKTVINKRIKKAKLTRSQIFRAPDADPAQTSSSVWPNRTHSTGVVWPDKLWKKKKIN